jgi:signal transduction histidine kinase
MAGGLLAFTVAVVLGIALGRRLGRPLAALRDAAVAFGEGRTDVVPVRSDDEIGDVVSAFETMRERVRDNHRTLVATEKMAAIGRLTAGIAHEMNSPLAALRLSVEELGDLVTEYRESIAAAGTSGADHRRICEEMGGALELADMASSRAVDFVRSIRSQTRLGHGTKAERFDVMAVVEDAVSLVRHAARAAGCELSVVAPTDRPEHLSGNASALAHAVTNLLQNAIDATSEAGGGEIEVAVEASRDVVSIRVADTGPGIPPEVLPRIFEALYTTKGYGHGTGLGLAIVKEAVEETFGGRVDVDTIVGQGTRFTMRIPRLGTHVAPQASAWTQSWAHGSGG